MRAEEFEGKNIDQAIEEACKFFQVTPEDLEIEIITHGSTGLFGIGAKKARIRARLKGEVALSRRAQEAEKVLREIIEAAGLDLSFNLETKDGKIQIELNGEDTELLVDKGGLPLNALQYLVNKIVARRLGVGPKVELDIQGFRAQQEERLREMARKAAEKARKTGRPVELRPMPSHERRLVHLTIKEIPGVETRSKGHGDSRRVVIYPQKRRSRRR
ncbi:MAG: protein jag [Thermodesulfobacteria bacterium]|nr:protein jag [Thermodesulfobacteriota bacterium]